MPRQARLDAPGTLHHVMLRAIEGNVLFRDEQDREDFLARVGDLTKGTGTRVLAWVLMDNHVHFLLMSGPEGLPSFMRKLLTGYAIRFNRKHQRRGHLFQNRYKSIVCEEDPYVRELVRYIHLNPLRASVVQSLEELDRYQWSGHSVLVGKHKNDWQESGYVLRLFGPEKKKALRAYRRFMEEGKHQGTRLDLIGGGLLRSLGSWSQVRSLRYKNETARPDPRILGSGDFVKEILKEANKKVQRQLGNRERKHVIDQTIKKECAKAGIQEVEVRRGGQRGLVSKVRGRIAYCLNREMAMPMAEIARNLGVCTSAIAKAIKRLESAKGDA